jgi:2-dehydropantoate 2-reductase
MRAPRATPPPFNAGKYFDVYFYLFISSNCGYLETSKRHLMHNFILGAGGVGGLIGAVLAHADEQVTLVVRPDALAHHPRELSLDSKFGKFTVPVSLIANQIANQIPSQTANRADSMAVTAGKEADWRADILWISVKATQLESALKGIPNSASIRAVVPLLNGIDHVALLRARFGHDRVIPATFAGESERTAPGVIVHRSPFARINAATVGRPLLEPVMEHFTRFGFECKFIENENTLLWSKLAFLAPLALSTTAAGVPIGGLRSDAVLNARLEACLREACAVALASGAEVNADALLAVANGLPAAMKSSMQRDLEAGNPLELDAIAGPILRGAAQHGLAATVTRELVDVINRNLHAK